MKTWIISDTHFNHDKLLEEDYGGRPLNWAEKFQKNIKVVQKEDLLIHCGDVCIGKDEEMHAKFIVPIPAKKILVRGNHDKKSTTWYLNHGWDMVVDTFIDYRLGKRVLYTHIPSPDLYGCDFNIHGHIHNRPIPPFSPQHKLVAMELTDYHPVRLETLLNS